MEEGVGGVLSERKREGRRGRDSVRGGEREREKRERTAIEHRYSTGHIPYPNNLDLA